MHAYAPDSVCVSLSTVHYNTRHKHTLCIEINVLLRRVPHRDPVE